MIPFDLMPGAKQWVNGLPRLIAHGSPLWIWGAFGSGVTTLSQWLAEQRGTQAVEYDLDLDIESWLKANPRGVLASEQAIGAFDIKPKNFIELKLWSLDDDPSAIQECLEHLAQEEGLQTQPPPVLGQLPCNGNLTELRNRVIRWHLLGQTPEPETDNHQKLLEPEDIASNLHILEQLLLHRALRRSYGNRVEAAKRLGVSRRQLYLLIERHGDPVRGVAPVVKGLKRLKRVKE